MQSFTYYVWCNQMGSVFAGMSSWKALKLTYRDEDSIIDQSYQKQIFWDLYYEYFNFKEWLRKVHIKRNRALNNEELVFKNILIKNPNIFTSIYLV